MARIILGIAQPPGFNAASLTQALQGSGVRHVTASAATGRLTVEYDPAVTDPTTLQNALQSIGFRSWVVAVESDGTG